MDNFKLLYVSPPERAYVVMRPFEMPTAKGPVWAVALPTSSAVFVNAALSVVLTIMFTWLWGLIAAATLYFAPHHFSRRRLVTLVALRNAPDPWAACKAFAALTLESMGCFRQRRPGRPSTWRDTAFACGFAIVALSVVATSVVIGIMGPPFFQIGNVAPVEATEIYFPRSMKISDARAYRALRAEPSLRALSSVEVFGKSIGERVHVSEDSTVKTTDPSRPMYGLTYGYNITGVELGLQRETDLMLSVRGACRTEYGWFDRDNKNDTFEIQFIFNNPNQTFKTTLTEPLILTPPKPYFFLQSNADEIDNQSLAGNISYAVAATVSHRQSTRAGTDPWYLTEPSGSGSDNPYRIKAGRPALSCWHQDVWSCCGGKSVNGTRNLSELESLAVPQALQDVFAIALLTPPVQRVGRDAVMSALSSAISTSGAVNGVLDAATSSIFRDMERLIMAGYVSTLNILGDSTLFEPSPEDYKNSNWFTNETTGELLDEADAFVVQTSSVQTFNLTGLITLAVIIFVMLVTKLWIALKVLLHRNIHGGGQHDDVDPNLEVSPFNKDRWARFKAFSAVHLLRNTYEDGAGAPEDDWRCGEDLPDPREEKPLWLAKCKHNEVECCGHIATDRKLLGLQARSHHVKNNSISTIGDESFQSYAGGPQSFALPSYSLPRQEYHDDFRSPDLLPGMGDDSPGFQYGQVQSGNPYFSQFTPPVPTNTQYQDDTTQHTAPLLPLRSYRYSGS
ncbi:hypothetical protein B0H67DRAFT_262423 [Lasiosphaeris hirsuta]|uniref:Uncharacterized protein n=1 Tax=Lasiosphaeris hirsuta TaxID=260670 RepID=A0AA40DNW9_9PEZI|nr:hypothetical protein B0H67DRAFT_262423 [Lasiosphaeris hirsuta]